MKEKNPILVSRVTAQQTQQQESSTAGRDLLGKSELYKSRHASEFTELTCNQQVWMQHHITGKWNTKAMVRRKRKDGNSYIVCAPDGNTYIRGRCLLKPISSTNHLNEDSAAPQHPNPQDSADTSTSAETTRPEAKKRCQEGLQGTTTQPGQQIQRSSR